MRDLNHALRRMVPQGSGSNVLRRDRDYILQCTSRSSAASVVASSGKIAPDSSNGWLTVMSMERRAAAAAVRRRARQSHCLVRRVVPAQFTAFSKASSLATCRWPSAAANAGMPQRTARFALPLGATVQHGRHGDLDRRRRHAAASLLAIAAILPQVGLPVEAIGLALAVDRLLDMCRTAVNVTGDLMVTALVGCAEGEQLPGVAARDYRASGAARGGA